MYVHWERRDMETPEQSRVIRAAGQGRPAVARSALPLAVGAAVAIAAGVTAIVLYMAVPGVRVWVLAGAAASGPLKAQARERLAGVRDARAVPLLRRTLSHSSGNVRLAAAEALAAIREPEPPVDALIGLLDDRYHRCRAVAAVALAEIGDERGMEALVEAVGRGHWDAACALGSIGDARALPALVAPLSEKWTGRRKKVEAFPHIAKIGGSGALNALLLAAAHDPHPGVGRHARLALESLGEQAVQPLIDHVIERITSYGDLGGVNAYTMQADRPAASRALSSIGQPAIEPLIRCVGHENARVGSWAVSALKPIRSPRAVDGIAQALADPRRQVHERAAAGLQQIGAPAVEPVAGLLEHEDAAVRWRAASVLRRIGSSRAAELLAAFDEFRALQELFAEGSTTSKLSAVHRLAAMGDARAVHLLLSALGDSDNEVSSRAADALEVLGTRAVPLLIEALADAQPRVRHRAAGVLGKTGDARAVQPLSQAWRAARYARGDNIRYSAAQALVTIGEPALSALIEALSDEGAEVRRVAAISLGRVGNPSATAPLIGALRDADGLVRGRAAEALLQVGDCQATIDRIDAAGVLDAFVLALVGRRATGALTEIGPNAVAMLTQDLQDADETARSRAAVALGRMGPVAADAIPALTKLLNDGDKGVRTVALEALTRLGERPAQQLPELLEALRDGDAAIRRAAAGALSEMGPDAGPAVPALIEALKDVDASVRSLAANALGKTRDARSFELLITSLSDIDPGVRVAAADALGRIGDVRSIEPLIARLEDGHWKVRSRAEKALGGIVASAAGPPASALTAALRSPNRDVRGGAAGALSRLGAEHAVDPLVIALGDSDHGVRVRAAVALRNIAKETQDKAKLEPAVPPLITALDDGHAPVRRTAAAALAETRDPRMVDALIAATQDKDYGVRLQAVGALQKIWTPKAQRAVRDHFSARARNPLLSRASVRRAKGTAGAASGPRKLTVGVSETAGGVQYTLQGASRSEGDMLSTLKQLAKLDPDQAVLVKQTGKVSRESVKSLETKLKGVGFRNIEFTEPAAE